MAVISILGIEELGCGAAAMEPRARGSEGIRTGKCDWNGDLSAVHIHDQAVEAH
jgi:hypothetical protein